MADQFDPEIRSKIMSRIRATDTKVEIIFRKALWEHKLRGYRVYYNLPGKPDIVFTKKKIAIFIDGDFWHGYSWKSLGKIPPKGYWQDKINKNIHRDKEINKWFKDNGWTILRFWEHEVKSNIDVCIEKVRNVLNEKIT